MNYWELVEIEGKVARLTNLKYKNMKLKAYDFTPHRSVAFGHRREGLGRRSFALIGLCDDGSLTNGAITFPDPAITLPVFTLGHLAV